MITKAELEQLRVSQPKLNNELHYTIGGTIETQVHAAVETERVSKLKHGEYRLQKALEEMRNNHVFATREGLAKAHFNQQSQEVKL